jgi:hypothetical protein
MLRFVSGFVMGMVAGTTLAGFAAGVFGELGEEGFQSW